MKKISIGICTFRRSSVLDSINGIAAQIVPPGCAIELIVADNDEMDTARSTIVDHARSVGVDVKYVHAPARNISIARNACLSAADGRWLAFHDDDGVASPDWIAQLIRHADGAQAVFGPALAVYDEAAPDWMRRGDFHSVVFDGPRGGYAGNVLIDLDFVRQHDLKFDERLGRTGGEDTFFFYSIHKLGGVLRFAPDAIVREPVPADRTTLKWLLKRRFRYGQVHGRLLQQFEPAMFRRLPLSACLKTVVCGVAAMSVCLSRSRCAGWLARGALHVGALSYCLNRTVREEYA